MTSASELLSSLGLRQTRARKIVLELLQEAGHPLSHQEIAVHSQAASLNRVTLYRTLTTLQQSGLLHRVQGTDGVWRFGYVSPRKSSCGGNHIHFLCVECHQMSCLPEQPLPWVTAPEGARVTGKQLVVYGSCASCERSSKGG